MCGRYYMDDETVEEIEKVIRLVDAKVHNRADLTMLQVGDIHPADLAPVIAGRNHEIQLEKSVGESRRMISLLSMPEPKPFLKKDVCGQRGTQEDCYSGGRVL